MCQRFCIQTQKPEAFINFTQSLSHPQFNQFSLKKTPHNKEKTKKFEEEKKEKPKFEIDQ